MTVTSGRHAQKDKERQYRRFKGERETQGGWVVLRKGKEKARSRSRPPGGGREKKEGPKTGGGRKGRRPRKPRLQRGQEEERDPNGAT